MKIKIILPLIFLALFSCSDDENTIDENSIPTPDPTPTNILTLVDSKSISTTPFTLPKETIVFEDNLYAIDDFKTYKYNFELNIWETINENNTDLDFEVADSPYFDYNVSFIKDDKWYIMHRRALWTFNFTTLVWTLEKQFFHNKLTAPIGFYENNTLYVFSDIFNTIYTYDFENNLLVDHSTFEQRPNYGQLTKSIFKIKGEYYFTKLSDYNKISVYKFSSDFKTFEYLNEYKTDYVAQGSGFIFNDKIIFGLGGEISVDQNNNISGYQLNNKFYYYDTQTNEFNTIANDFYEGRYLALPIEYNNEFYLLGGINVSNNQQKNKATLDKLAFKLIKQ
ncbi:Kelch repeat-containing protein [Aquimarina sediminis]|uniref:hypothetical protein n=1 Tax=Aquimarina sediminis TaxID=2070536 RepID=UPI000CA0257E|nr:hypothetical protein [Aquimarina sediminis]